MPDFDFTKVEKRFVPGGELKAGISQTETAIVDISSAVIKAGEAVLATGKSTLAGDVLVKAALGAQANLSVRGFALLKADISSYESSDYYPGSMIPVRRFGEVVVKLDTSFADPKIGDYVFLKQEKLVKEGKGGIQVGRIKDIDIRDKKLVLLDIQIGPEYEANGGRKFA
ncbi:hypothetical protein F0310_04395 (plasmid) [Borrelia sp. A-FGy1]|uniref:gp53 minor capsid family protein n=1 Tax=Borrelia sp. A-FGy1 TaxID=2608247 RepID=UPI0015F45284|nr:hypothetical protein [Borrelia sp. A-FGy1]QMU99657.1 hypothetical protein F0310_04395 [Borrelia sp. A-FGy1]